MGHFVTHLRLASKYLNLGHGGLRQDCDTALGKESMDNTVTTLVKLVNPPSLICRGVFLLESQASVRQTALLLPRHGLRALLDDRLRVLDVILAGSQGGECQSLMSK